MFQRLQTCHYLVGKGKVKDIVAGQQKIVHALLFGVLQHGR
jgi:hypothetical protein